MGKATSFEKIHRKSWLNPAVIICALVGIAGLLLLLTGLVTIVIGLFDVKLFIGLGIIEVFIGGLISMIWIPALYQSGLDLDPKNRRFREFEGTLGKTKGDWIAVEEGDYWSIVGVSQSIHSPRRSGTASLHYGMSKIYFFSGDWHLEVHKGHYEDALKLATKLSEAFDTPINDVNKDQDIGIAHG